MGAEVKRRRRGRRGGFVTPGNAGVCGCVHVCVGVGVFVWVGVCMCVGELVGVCVCGRTCVLYGGGGSWEVALREKAVASVHSFDIHSLLRWVKR